MIRLSLRRLGVALATLVLALSALPALAESDAGEIVVANRGSGDLSVIDANTLDVHAVGLPEGAEPMYVNHWGGADLVFVGDRGNDQVIALDDETYDVVGTVGVGAGVFHQWLDLDGRQLWVVGDTSGTVTVIDPSTLTVIETITVPADLTVRGGKPHDVFVRGSTAFVSIVGLDTGQGVVVRYSTRDFAETGRIVTGADPHLFVRGSLVYVASQGGSSVSAFRVSDLAPVGAEAVPSAHGIWVTPSGQVLVTSIAGGGTAAVSELGRGIDEVLATADTAFPVPHNITVDKFGRQAFVTHSGATANQVSIVAIGPDGFGGVQSVTVGTNPFGLTLND